MRSWRGCGSKLHNNNSILPIIRQNGQYYSYIQLLVSTIFVFMRVTSFFSVAIAVLAVAPTQIAATVEPSPLTAIGTQTSTPEPTNRDSTLGNRAIAEPTLLIAQQSRTQRIQFARGASSAVVESGVVRGTRDIYLLGARRRQTMTLNITSVEKNAVFDIQAPNGAILRQEATSWSGVLPATGDYKIIVGGTRGNASYRLQVMVK